MGRKRKVLDPSPEGPVVKHEPKDSDVLLPRLDHEEVAASHELQAPREAEIKTEENEPLVFDSLRDLCYYGIDTENEKLPKKESDINSHSETTVSLATSNEVYPKVENDLSVEDLENVKITEMANDLDENTAESRSCQEAIVISPEETKDIDTFSIKEEEGLTTNPPSNADPESDTNVGENVTEKATGRFNPKPDPILERIKKEFEKSDPIFTCNDSSNDGTLTAEQTSIDIHVQKIEPNLDLVTDSGFCVDAESIFDTVSRIKQEEDMICEVAPEEEGEVQSEIANLLSVNAIADGALNQTGAFTSLRDLVTSFSGSGKRTGRKKRGRRRKFNGTKCNKCNYETKSKGDLSKHCKYVHGDAIFACPISGCNFKTKFPHNIKHHLDSHSEERPFACTVCQATFKRKSQLGYHLRTHSDERPFQCPQCSYTAKRNWVLTSHIASKHSNERKYECDICGFKIKTRSDLTKHRRRHSAERKVRCTECDKTFKFHSSLSNHKKYVHGHGDVELMPCPNKGCKTKFKCKSQLDRHIKTVHDGIKDFTCIVCHHKFSSKSNLNHHLVTHDSTFRPHMCPLCPYRGQEKDHVLAHIGSMHGKLRMYSCTLCHVRFKVHHQLQQHLKTGKHQRNQRFALPPNDNEVEADGVDLKNTSFVEHPQKKVRGEDGKCSGKGKGKLEDNRVRTRSRSAKIKIDSGADTAVKNEVDSLE